MKVTAKSLKNAFMQNLLTVATFGGVVAGILLGVALKSVKEEQWSMRDAMYVKYIGTLFLSMLKCVIIPLVIPSLISAIGSMDLSLSGKVGVRAVVYYLATTVFAAILGIILVCSIRPGAGVWEQEERHTLDVTKKRNITTVDTLMDLGRNMVPPNIIQATIQHGKTTLIYPGEENVTDSDGKVVISAMDKNTWKFKTAWHKPVGHTNILGLVVFAVVMGVAISHCGEDGKPLLSFFKSVSIVMMKVTKWIIHLAPVGICFLIAGQILEMEDVEADFEKVVWYFFTVLLGLSIHGCIVLPTIFVLVTRTQPFRFIANMGNAIVTAFGTASSSATLPVTINSLEERNKVDSRIARFVLPIGATINMDGTALYEAVAALFIAQLSGVDVNIGQIIAISITATAASIGAAGIPQAGLVTMVMVLDTVGLPSESVSIILSVDWLLDRFRTAINVLGDSIGAGIVNHLSQAELRALDKAGQEVPLELRVETEGRKEPDPEL